MDQIIILIQLIGVKKISQVFIFQKIIFNHRWNIKIIIFDIIYATSVFTHLSEEMHYAWMNELKRICKPNGIIFLTTHGDNCKPKLTEEELKIFEAGKLVVRGNVKEGHRTFAAYQPPQFMRELFKDFEILEHVTREPEGNYIPQDVWIVRKK